MFYLAFLLGLTASLHCIGMCGPIALSVPVHHRSAAGKWAGMLVYNSGRLVSYMGMGILAGMVGYAFGTAGWQKMLSVFAGMLMIGAVAYSSGKFENLSTLATFRSGINTLKKLWKHLLHRKNFLSLWLIGLLNGLLPCGMVYMALISATAMPGPGESMLYMLFYGLGTFPAMMAVGMGARLIPGTYRARLTKITPWMIALTGLILIFRGIDFSHGMPLHKTEPIPVCGTK